MQRVNEFNVAQQTAVVFDLSGPPRPDLEDVRSGARLAWGWTN